MASIFNDNEKLRQYLEGTASDEVLAEVRAWLSEDPAHQAKLEALEALWADAPKSAYYQEIDSQADWKKVMGRLETDSASHTDDAGSSDTLGARPARTRRIWAVAATVALLAALSVLLLNLGGSDLQTIETIAEQQVLRLEDGSTITLRPRSRLSYPKTFAANERRLELEAGEAFFDVSHNPARPFRVESGAALVEVKGTSFSVGRKGQKTSVSVRTGKVQCQVAKMQTLLLPGRSAEMFDDEGLLVPFDNTPNQFSWKSDTLTFAGTPLAEVIRDLSHHYDVDIETGPQFDSTKEFTTEFVGAPLDEVLSEMELILGVRSRRENNKIVLE